MGNSPHNPLTECPRRPVLTVDQALRCYMVEAKSAEEAKPEDDPSAPHEGLQKSNAADTKYNERVRPFDGYILTFDTETFSFSNGQRARFGVWQLRGIPYEERRLADKEMKDDREFRDHLSQMTRRGIFYDPKQVTHEETLELERFVSQENSRIEHDVLTGMRLPKFALMKAQEFIRCVLYGLSEEHGDDLIIAGHNLAFDLGGLAQNVQLSKGDWYGGFSLKLCDCKPKRKKRSRKDEKNKEPEYEDTFDCRYHNTLRIKPLGTKSRKFGWTAVPRWPDDAPQGSRPESYEGLRSNFVDTAQMARALLGETTDCSLENLSHNVFKTQTRKSEFEAFDDPISETYLNYCVNDVEATFEVLRELMMLYRQYGVSKKPWSLFSVASPGKAHYDDFGIKPFLEQNKKFDPAIIGCCMQTFYAGRSEARIAKEIREVIHTDFKSQYPSVNALLGMQKFLLAKSLKVRRDTETLSNARNFLEQCTLDKVLKPETWAHPLMKSLVMIEPSGDILPVRAKHPGAKSFNIGLQEVVGGRPGWYTMLDAVASFTITKKAPKIIDAITFIPEGRIETKKLNLMSDPRYQIDLSEDDLFTRLIDMRTEVKAEIENIKKGASKNEDLARLEATEQALKLISSSTCYGVFIEINRDERYGSQITVSGKKTGKPGWVVDLYAGDHKDRLTVAKLEEPGDFFAPPIATHITAGGRLLLAICERLAADRAIDYVFCDTDSMCFARSENMEHGDFQRSVKEIVDAFIPLYPYANSNKMSLSILEYEDVNYRDGKKENGFEPLYALAISAKRYVLFNRIPFDPTKHVRPSELFDGFADLWGNGTDQPGTYPVIRKFSSHGTGPFNEPANYQSFTPKPDCERGLRRNAKGKLEGKPLGKRRAMDQLMTDLWRCAIIAADQVAIKPPRFPFEIEPSSVIGQILKTISRDQLSAPVISHTSLSSRGVWERFKHLPHRRPFMFFSTMPSLKMGLPENDYPDYEAIRGVGFYGPRSRTFSEIKDTLHRGDNHELFKIEEFTQAMSEKYNDGSSEGANDYDFNAEIAHKSLFDAMLPHYFTKQEYNSFPSNGVGLLQRQKIFISGSLSIGKETDNFADELERATGLSLQDEHSGKRSKRRDKNRSDVICLNPAAAKLDNAFLQMIDLKELACATGYDIKRLQRWQRGETAIPPKERQEVLRAVNHMAGFHDRVIAGRIAKAKVARSKSAAADAERKLEILRDRMSAITPDWWNRCPPPDEGAPGGPRFNKNRSITDSPSTGPDRIIMKMMKHEGLLGTGILTQEELETAHFRARELRSLVRQFLTRQKVPSSTEMKAMRAACDAVMNGDRSLFDWQCAEAARLYGDRSPAFEFWQSARPAWMGPWKPNNGEPVRKMGAQPGSQTLENDAPETAARYGAMEGVLKTSRDKPALLPLEEIIRRCGEASKSERPA